MFARAIQKVVNLARTEYTYSHQKPRRVLFDHLPKCAGNTIATYLKVHFPRRLVFQTDSREPKNSVEAFRSLPQRTRFHYQMIIGHLTHDLLDFVHPDTVTMTVLREPIDRMISHYYFVKQDDRNYLHDQVMKSEFSLEDYANSKLSVETQNWYTTHFTGLTIEEVESNPDDALRLAAETVRERYDIVGFQDDLTSAAERLRDIANLSQPFVNVVRNSTRSRVGVREIPVSAKHAIARANSVDIKLFAMLKENADGRAVNVDLPLTP